MILETKFPTGIIDISITEQIYKSSKYSEVDNDLNLRIERFLYLMTIKG
jgi:hypothetical protein